MISRIASAIVAVADQDVMRDFFVERLGFTLLTDAEMWPGARWVEVVPSGGGTGLVLSAAKDFGRDPDPQYPMTFGCADLVATAAELRAAGVEVTDPVTEPWGSYIRVTDPEGRALLVNDKA
ncbi:VOC family protein [Pseudonocardia nigra]|uniref:VOC family protein n=1 Tax=Pseudonocardia nigra TaxID=1921578 RepID=UPI001C5D2EF4|nr:VOC family protein [Pseudonocardia nigra]